MVDGRVLNNSTDPSIQIKSLKKSMSSRTASDALIKVPDSSKNGFSSSMASPSSSSSSTPLPKGTFLALSVVLVLGAMNETILYPFAPLMVSNFHVTRNEANLGYYAGFLASSFFLGQLISSTFWGYLSDRLGRKPVLVMALFSTAAWALMFGFSASLEMAMAARFCSGLFSGLYIVGKTMMSELTDGTNQAQGFSIIGLSWGVGFLVGPALGGFTAQPSIKYPHIFENTPFSTFPFALPCVILAGISLLGLLLTFFLIPETLKFPRDSSSSIPLFAKSKTDLDLEKGEGKLRLQLSRVRSQDSRESEFDKVPKIVSEPDLEKGEGQKHSIVFGHGMATDSDQSLGIALTKVDSEKGSYKGGGDYAKGYNQWVPDKVKVITSGSTKAPGYSDILPSSKFATMEVGFEEDVDPGYWRVLCCDRNIIICTWVYALIGFATTSQNEVFPLWSLGSPQYGGLSLDSETIGLVQAAAGLALIPFQMFLYAPLARRLGPLLTLQGSLVFMSLLAGFPLVRLLPDTRSRALASAGLMMLRSITAIAAFTSNLILLANSVQFPWYLGAVNGFSQTVQMALRAMAPSISASIFAWSISANHSFPFDYHFYWLLWGFVCFVMLLLSMLLPQSLSKPSKSRQEF